MAYEKPISIREAVENIQRKKYVLPSIQREFVWESSQIEMLFDSLMRDYPISTFLFWSIEKSKIGEFQFYEFLQHYHERDATHNPKASLARDEDVVAILDGQQRLTSLYIALNGTYAEKIKYYSWDNSGAFPKKKLYLNLLRESDDIEMYYDFKFLTDAEAKANKDNYWFEIGKILNFKEYPNVMEYLMSAGLTDSSKFPPEQGKFAMNALNNLFNVIHQKGTINFYLEKGEGLDKVLQIFIRTNSGGTKLSYSDLLLSIATAQWSEKDAREEIHEFVDDINRNGFDFDKDFVLKACLVLGDFTDVKFKVDNFTKTNMLKIEKLWDDITRAIQLSVKLVSSFGFNRETLTSYNTLIPISYYLMKIDADDSFLHQAKHQVNRDVIREWLLRVLLKRTFSGTPDNLYPQLRKLTNDSNGAFPLQSVVDFYKGTNKSIVFSDDDVNGLCSLNYGNKFTFAALALLYPELNLNFKFHMDHIFPKKYFTEKRLKKLGLSEVEVRVFLQNFNLLPNLQLLEGNENKQKSAAEFKVWLSENYPSKTSRQSYLKTHHIPEDVSLELKDFQEFFAERKKIIVKQFYEILGMNKATQ